jgi:hypothetical protein
MSHPSWPGTSVQISSAQRIMETVNACELAILSQEGSVIAFFAMTRGVVPQTKCLRMHT